ncbi:MAG: hypothetical protein ACO3EL_02370 [Burkholderiaceae bacterium]
MNSIPTSVTIAPASGARIKLHVYTSSSPILLLRVVRFLAQRAVAVEIGNNFVKFPRTDSLSDQAAAELKTMGFRVLTSMDQFTPEADHLMQAASATLLAQENTPKGHVHGPDCGHDHGHDHVHDAGCGHTHDHAHDHSHAQDHAHDHAHDHSHTHEHSHKHTHDKH